jgi:asparagine synthase (glutamine-hydrolysing)
MCGIAGIVNINNESTYIKNMLMAMHHRGPDDWGTFAGENIVLGHKRLSIIDLSPAGHQPMTSSNGKITMVFNGEVYNYKELKALVPETTDLKSTTDTEVILELWNIMGTAVLPKLRGMFALAVWNTETKELILARDHMGIKPLYYQVKNNQLVFASEMKGMLASGLVNKKISNKAVYQYLSNGYIMQPNTIIEDVYMLEPASYLKWKNGECSTTTFWKVTDKQPYNPKSEQEAIKAVYQLVNDAVKEEAISDRPLGVFLSGGLDSTVLVAALAKSGVSEIKTFSVGFNKDDLSEEDDAKAAAKFYGTKHTQLQVNDEDIVPHFQQYIKALDQPSIDGLNTWLVSKVTTKHVTVALSGLGGDELFSGYSIDRNYLDKKSSPIFSKLIYATKGWWKYAPLKLKNKLQAYSNSVDLPQLYKSWGSLFDEKEITQLIKLNDKENQFRNIDLGKSYSSLQRISYMHQRGFMLSRLLRDSDAVSMDHSIEVRFPIIDVRLVNLSFNLPDEWKIKKIKQTAKLKNYEKENSYEQNNVKHLLYQAFKSELPPAFGKRPKRGFKMPIEKWMQKGLLHDIDSTLTSTLYLNHAYTQEVYSKWLKGEVNWTKVWAIYILEKWMRENLG